MTDKLWREKYQFLNDGILASWRIWLQCPNTIRGVAYRRNVNPSTVRNHVKLLLKYGMIEPVGKGQCHISGRTKMQFYEGIPEEDDHD